MQLQQSNPELFSVRGRVVTLFAVKPFFTAYLAKPRCLHQMAHRRRCRRRWRWHQCSSCQSGGKRGH